MLHDHGELDKERLVKEHYELVFRTLTRLCCCREDAADLTQGVFIAAVRNWSRFQRRSSVGTWLVGIAYRMHKDHLRKTRQTESLMPNLAAQAPPSTGWLIELFEDLPDGQREAFYLFEVEGFSVQEISLITGSPSGTVKARLHFARIRLRKRIQEQNRREAELFI